MITAFVTIGKAQETGGDDPLAGLDASKMEQILSGLMRGGQG